MGYLKFQKTNIPADVFKSALGGARLSETYIKNGKNKNIK